MYVHKYIDTDTVVITLMSKCVFNVFILFIYIYHYIYYHIALKVEY